MEPTDRPGVEIMNKFITETEASVIRFSKDIISVESGMTSSC